MGFPVKLALTTIAAIAVLTVSAQADTFVRGYLRSDGTYVQPHMRSSADSYKSNNYSTYGNTNPYTGQNGTRRYGGNCSGYYC